MGYTNFGEDNWSKSYRTGVPTTVQINTVSEFFDKDFDDQKLAPEFEEFVPKLPEYGMGTGFFINKIHIVTNYHVIKHFNTFKKTFQKRRKRQAKSC